MEPLPRSIADSVGLLRRQLGLGSASGFAAMTEMWPGLVGEELSSRCRVIDLRAGVQAADQIQVRSRASRPSASARACTSVPPVRPVCTTWCTRWSTTRSTRHVHGRPLHSHRLGHGLLADGGCEVVDDGRGIPVDKMHPEVPETCPPPRSCSRCCTPAASSAAAATRSPAACTAWASRWSTRCPSPRRGRDRPRRQAPRDEFADGGELVERLHEIGDAPADRTGTTVRFWPDPTIFDETQFRAQTLIERFQMMAFLNAGLEITLRDERADGTTNESRSATTAASSTSSATSTRRRRRCSADVGYFAAAAEETMEVEIAFQWNTGYNTDGMHSFANGITTIEGGMHEEGFKKALTNTVNKYARPREPSRRRTPTSRARTSARGSPRSSR
jgi:hypothetical protein